MTPDEAVSHDTVEIGQQDREAKLLGTKQAWKRGGKLTIQASAYIERCRLDLAVGRILAEGQAQMSKGN